MPPVRGSGLAAVLALALSACSAPSPSPATAPPTGDPSDAAPGSGAPASAPGASHTAEPADPGDALAAGTEVLVIADEIRLRAEPGTESELLGTVGWGTAATVRSGPVDRDAFAWYEIETDGQTGWAAAGDDEDPWIVPVGPAPGAEAVLTFSETCDVVPPVTTPTTTILADGTVVTGRGELQVGRLNDEGLAVVRDDVLGLPVLRQPGTYVPEPLPGAEPPGHGACEYTFIVGGADTVTVSSIMWFGDEEESEFYAPAPERRLLSNVARNLGEIGSLFDDRLWREAPRTYVATEFLLVLVPFPGPGADAVAYDRLGLPSPDDLEPSIGGTRCTVVTLEQAVTAVREIRDAGNPVGINGMATTTADDGELGWSVIIVPRTPLGSPECGDVNG
jgi:hypothetical protein